MKRLAEETGGGYFELDKTSDLAPTFTRVAQELHSQYVLGFTPTLLDGKVHRMTVKAKSRHDRPRAGAATSRLPNPTSHSQTREIR